MENFEKQVLEKEVCYIWDKYLGKKIVLTSEFEEIPERMTKVCNAICNGKEYRLYKSPTEISLIPIGLTDLSDDFYSIISYGQNEIGFGISICTRKNKNVETITHSFTTEKNSAEKIRTISTFASYNDENNELQKRFQEEGVSLDIFVIRNSHLHLPKETPRFVVNIVKNEESTKWTSSKFDMKTITALQIDELYNCLNIVEDNETPMLKLAEEINRKTNEKKESKVYKKA